MNNIYECLDDLYDGKAVWIYAIKSFLPDSFPDDMKKIFGLEPEHDIYSNVYSGDDEGWFTDGVITCIKGDMDSVITKITEYAKEKEIPDINIFYEKDGNIASKVYESAGGDLEDSWDVLFSNDGSIVVDTVYNVYIDDAEPGFTV